MCLCLGLCFLHNNKIIHRYVEKENESLKNKFNFSDLKPANILIKKDGILKLADFGLSKIMKPRGGKKSFFS